MPDRTYRWEGRRPGRKVHVLNSGTGRVWCKLENMQRKRAFDSEGTALPPGRKTCKNCLDLAERGVADYREPDVRVLIGERLAEEGPDLFAIAPKPRKLGRQARPARRAKGHKPKHSKVKHVRTFNDDLPPWL